MRGTGEAGNIGVIVGPEFFGAVATRVDRLTLAVKGVDCAADTQVSFRAAIWPVHGRCTNVLLAGHD